MTMAAARMPRSAATYSTSLSGRRWVLAMLTIIWLASATRMTPAAMDEK
jgi:hypothetical protein